MAMACLLNSSICCLSNPISFAFASPQSARGFSFSFSDCSSLARKKNHGLFLKSGGGRTRSTLDEKDQSTTSAVVLEQEKLGPNVVKSIELLKSAAKTRKVASEEILSALSVIEKAKIDPSGFFDTLGGTKSPGRTWMLIYTAEKKLEKGRYFPLTAVQRFDAAGKRIENGVFLGAIGFLTFEGRLSWKKRILAFVFERIRIKLGPFNPLEIGLGQTGDREPSTKDPFFLWLYIDEEIAVARGKSGGTAFWCRCCRMANT